MKALASLCGILCTCMSVTLYGTPLKGGDMLVADPHYDAIVKVDPLTGNREFFSGGVVGSGPSFEGVVGITLDRFGNVFVTDEVANAVFAIDPTTGDRQILSSDDLAVGTGPALARPFHIDTASTGDLLMSDFGRDAVMKVNQTTGNRSILSDLTHGNGPLFLAPEGLAVGRDDSIYVGDFAAVIKVDPDTGDRTVISSTNEPAFGLVGSGPSFNSALPGVFVDQHDDLYVINPEKGLFHVDTSTGDRTLVSGQGVGAGPVFSSPETCSGMLPVAYWLLILGLTRLSVLTRRPVTEASFPMLITAVEITFRFRYQLRLSGPLFR
ncbi:hypothetical protein [Marinobacterium aestuariivivens]|uniref:SMP-30/Gluconolactonase/LRE-like region domain-containing protein n=1 Tax=Marinobacterium aestuariivivens TaxID=1698799 RepID=A0ABW2A9J7_9GAMM